MKKLIILTLLTAAVSSCKIIKVKEKTAFTESKYDSVKYFKTISESNLGTNEKIVYINIISDLINTDKVNVYKDREVEIKRQFYAPNDSIRLEYFEFIPKEFNKSGLFFLGNGSSVVNIFNELKKIAIESKSKIYILNYRAYGKSDGTPSFKTVFNDNQQFFDFISKSDSNIDFTIGYSLGSVSATYLAVDNKINNLILLAPVSNANEIFKYMKRKKMTGAKAIFRPFIKITADEYLKKISNTEKIKKYNGRLTIFHAKDDQTLPYSMGVNLYKNCLSKNKELKSIENGGHAASFQTENLNLIIKSLNQQ